MKEFMKKGIALIIGLVLVLLVIGGIGVYYLLNKQNKIAPEVAVVKSTPTVTIAPTVTPSLDEELNSLDRDLQEATNSSDFEEIEKDLGEL